MLFGEIDDNATKENVNNLLMNYHRIRRMAGAPYEQKITASYSFAPKSYTGTVTDTVGDAVQRKVDAESMLSDIQQAVNCLGSRHRMILYHKYISTEELYDYQIYDTHNISKTSFYKRLKEAQLEFAEAFRAGELIKFAE